ncbi:DNA-binding protein [Seonamhaeicola algicola]|uniref:DNA-binding protein n=2 Tax=Seonamhaeicola algicola TaxID=1719036 RepID=A0A5C7ATN2_9FLAO|nr:DNA-binding protein [Seonamhaeicola algicola]
MSILFRVLQRRNPQDITLPEKFYAAAIGDGSVDMETLAEQIAYQCTITQPDCYAVLMALERNIVDALKQGRIVKLGHLGNFQVGISSQGRDTAEELDASAITKARILFRPGKSFRQLLKNLSFRKARS